MRLELVQGYGSDDELVWGYGADDDCKKKADCSQPQIHPQSGDKSSALNGSNFVIIIRNGLICGRSALELSIHDLKL